MTLGTSGNLLRRGWPAPPATAPLPDMDQVGHVNSAVATPGLREPGLVSLLGRMARGDQLALGTFCHETRRLIYGLVVRILRDHSAAEDVAVEVYAEAYRRAAAYDPSRGSPSAWLLTLARSRAIDRLRKERQWRTRELPLETGAPIPSEAAGPEESSLATERRRVVRAALATLSPEQRQAIEIAYYTGLSHSEIAARLGVPLGTVKTRIRTGMMLLRERLRTPTSEDVL